MYYGTSNGKSLNETLVETIIEEVQNKFESLSNEIDKLIDDPLYSVGYVLDELYDQLINNLKSKNILDEDLIHSVYENIIEQEKSDFAIDNFNQLSALGFNEYENMPGDEFTNLKNGFISLINELKRNVSYAINLDEPVLNIDLRLRNKIRVKTSKQIYEADYVISTVSLGYMKSNYDKLFNPKLNLLAPQKVNAINRLGFGTVDKLFFVFDEPIFTDGEQGFQIFWQNDMDFLDSKYNLKVIKE